MSLIPADAPLVVWAPVPEQSLRQLEEFLSVFNAESLGEQLRVLRGDLQKNAGFDLFDPEALRAQGLDTSAPWALAYDASARMPVLLVAARDPAQVIAKLRAYAKDTGMLERAVTAKSNDTVYTLGDAFGDALAPRACVRGATRAVLIAFGGGCEARLAQWPGEEALRTTGAAGPASFGKRWKKAGPDGSLPGAALRLYASAGALHLDSLASATHLDALASAPHLDTPASARRRDLTPSVAPGPSSSAASAPWLAPNTELRGAVGFAAHRVELFATLLNLAPAAAQTLIAPAPAATPGVGMPPVPLLWARSELGADVVLALARAAAASAPMWRGPQEQIGRQNLDASMAALIGATTGAGSLAIAARAGGAGSLVDLFTIAAVADVSKPERFDAALAVLEKTLATNGVRAQLTHDGGPLLDVPSTRAPIALARRDHTVIFGLGRGAFEQTADRVQKKQGLVDHPFFAPLAAQGTSGIIVDMGAVLAAVTPASRALFGEQNGGAVGALFDRMLGSLKHVRGLGATLAFEGPAYEPHPTMRAWVETQ